MSSPDGDLLVSDRIHFRQMEEDSLNFLRALRGQPVKRVRRRREGWNERTWSPSPTTDRQIPTRQLAQTLAERERWQALKVDRDPCAYCGTRSDIGCGCRS